MKLKSITASLCALAFSAAPSLVLAQVASCYPAHIASPPITSQTIVLVDLTTATPEKVVESFKGLVKGAGGLTAQRLVVLTFAGLSPSEGLTKIIDGVIEAKVTDQAIIDVTPIRPFKRSQACVNAENQRWAARVDAAVTEAFRPRDRKAFERSEIVFALHGALGSYAENRMTTRFLVYSDGLQHGSGQSFYGRGRRPRLIDVEKELGKLPAAMRVLPTRDIGVVQVLWSGLLAGNAQGTGAYFDTELVNGLQAFWTKLIGGWGAVDVQTNRELLNPKLFVPATTNAVQHEPARLHLIDVGGR